MKIIIVASLLLATPALAQQPGPAPCTRGPSTVQMGGVDVDELKCAAALAQQQMGIMQGTLVQMEAQIALLRADLAAAKAAQTRPPEAPLSAAPEAKKP